MNGANLLFLLEKHGHKAKIDLKEAKELNNQNNSQTLICYWCQEIKQIKIHHIAYNFILKQHVLTKIKMEDLCQMVSDQKMSNIQYNRIFNPNKFLFVNQSGGEQRIDIFLFMFFIRCACIDVNNVIKEKDVLGAKTVPRNHPFCLQPAQSKIEETQCK